MKGLLQRVLRLGRGGPPPIDYDESKRLIQSGDPKDRRRVASHPQSVPEVLYFLATDRDPAVRAAVAANQATPVQADLLLARDESEEVRGDLASKIGRLMPELGQQESLRFRDMTYEVLDQLIRDEAVRVRRIMAEALRDLPDAPVSVIGRLARDPALEVAAPVLQYSPLLTDEDLLDILKQIPRPGMASAVAKRHNLSTLISEEIGEGDDPEAIAALLANGSAQIREETLDRLIDLAPKHVSWHQPLVARPRLSDSAAKKLALFVARDLLAHLQQRRDLGSEAVAAVKAVVLERLGSAQLPEAPAFEAPSPVANAAAQPAGSSDEMLVEARRLNLAGELGEDYLVEILLSGQTRFIGPALAVRADVNLVTVEKILTAQSAKGVVALIWKAGLSMRFAVRVQSVLARLIPTQILKPAAGGGFPLSEEAMTWQLGFFADMAGQEEGRAAS